jgi:predicted PurR-regulated permease PerM
MKNKNIPVSYDITRITLAVLFIGALITATFWIMKPFLTSLIWATIIAVATWPLLLKLQAWLRHRRFLAVTVMTIILLMVLVIPFSLAVFTIIESADKIAGWIKSEYVRHSFNA